MIRVVRAIRYSPAEQAVAKNSMVMPRHQVDEIDLKLLAALQNDGRLTNIELSKFVGLSAPPCLRRVRTLEENGFICGYHADLDAKMLGFPVAAFAFVGLVSQAEAELKTFTKLVSGWHTVREAYALQGEVDYLLKCVAHDLTEFQAFITDVLLKTANVRTVKTSLIFDTAKRAAGLPLKFGSGIDRR
jgi:DNA-binding Lrp family transcriptional regulator